MKFGEVDIIEQKAMTEFPQPAASAWAALEGAPLAGANYKPLLYIGGQPVKGVNHIFIAEQTLILAKPERHIVLVTINEFDNNYNVVSIERIV